MLCPEVSNFPAPKVISSYKSNERTESVIGRIKMNSFYKSLIVTCPDELQPPNFIEEGILVDSDYYKITNCSLTEFLDPTFVNKFVKNGKLFCLSVGRNCIAQNCAAITPDGVLTLHILDYIYQSIGLEGIRRPHNFYEVNIHLKNLRHTDKLRHCLRILETFDFYISWEPNQEDVCPSSIAKYFYDRNISIFVQSVVTKKLTPIVEEIPCPKDVEPDEMVEWLGMLAIEGDLAPTEPYISTYSQPESNRALKSTRISVFIAKGFFTPTLITNVSQDLVNYVSSRELDNYWASISLQSQEDSLWQWNRCAPKMFQAHNSSYNIFFTNNGLITYSIGQLKYS